MEWHYWASLGVTAAVIVLIASILNDQTGKPPKNPAGLHTKWNRTYSPVKLSPTNHTSAHSLPDATPSIAQEILVVSSQNKTLLPVANSQHIVQTQLSLLLHKHPPPISSHTIDPSIEPFKNHTRLPELLSTSPVLHGIMLQTTKRGLLCLSMKTAQILCWHPFPEHVDETHTKCTGGNFGGVQPSNATHVILRIRCKGDPSPEVWAHLDLRNSHLESFGNGMTPYTSKNWSITHDYTHNDRTGTMLALAVKKIATGSLATFTDVLFEADARNGTILHMIDLTAMLRPYFVKLWEDPRYECHPKRRVRLSTAKDEQLCQDASHLNYGWWEVEPEVVYVNSRRLATFFAIDKKKGELMWSCGSFGNLKMLDENGETPYRLDSPLKRALFAGAHGVTALNSTHFVVYDNGATSDVAEQVSGSTVKILKVDLKQQICQVVRVFRVTSRVTPYHGTVTFLPGAPLWVMGKYPQRNRFYIWDGELSDLVWKMQGRASDRLTWPGADNLHLPVIYPAPLIDGCSLVQQDEKAEGRRFYCKVWNSYLARFETKGRFTLWKLKNDTNKETVRKALETAQRKESNSLPSLFCKVSSITRNALSQFLDVVEQRQVTFKRGWDATLVDNLRWPTATVHTRTVFVLIENSDGLGSVLELHLEDGAKEPRTALPSSEEAKMPVAPPDPKKVLELMRARLRSKKAKKWKQKL